jgi:hypothetical protein
MLRSEIIFRLLLRVTVFVKWTAVSLRPTGERQQRISKILPLTPVVRILPCLQ